MCKVDEPRYIVAFANQEEFAEFGLRIGSNVHYVNDHSKSVFTKGLRGKVTDGSRIHDEDVAEDLMDFSDDEVKAESGLQIGSNVHFVFSNFLVVDVGGIGALAAEALSEDRL